MKRINYTKAFKKDYKAAIKRNLDVNKLMKVITLLAEGEDLPERYNAHLLKGKWQDFFECHSKWQDFFECHINPDWLLIWTQDQDNIYLARTGSHSDLF